MCPSDPSCHSKSKVFNLMRSVFQDHEAQNLQDLRSILFFAVMYLAFHIHRPYDNTKIIINNKQKESMHPNSLRRRIR